MVWVFFGLVIGLQLVVKLLNIWYCFIVFIYNFFLDHKFFLLLIEYNIIKEDAHAAVLSEDIKHLHSFLLPSCSVVSQLIADRLFIGRHPGHLSKAVLCHFAEVTFPLASRALLGRVRIIYVPFHNRDSQDGKLLGSHHSRSVYLDHHTSRKHQHCHLCFLFYFSLDLSFHLH